MFFHGRMSSRFVVLVFITALIEGTCGTGTFWHISDHHLDPYYSANAEDVTKVCPSSYGVPTPNAGPFGDYRCDSPWKLINSSVHAMKLEEPNPDFIIWTGDDTLHTAEQDKYLGKDKVIEIVGNITMLLKDAFPTTKFYAALGNHDFHPKSQIPPGGSEILTAIADMWKDWMEPQAYEKFKENGYYNESFGDGHRLISLNSNFWYDSNKVVNGTGDPGDEFQWLEQRLKESRDQLQKVFIIGHVPPGYFELVADKRWYYPEYSKRFNEIIRLYADVIAGQFFGHHHTDTFRLFKDGNRTVSSMLLTPGVTPWMTTLPGADDGANNPGIRLYEYDTATLKVQDFQQFYLNLTSANKETSGKWDLEYRATTAYNISDVTTSSLEKLAKTMVDGCEPADASCPDVFTDYYKHNSVSYNMKTCDETCQRNHLCAITEVEIEGHESCISTWGNGAKGHASLSIYAVAVVWLAVALP